MDSGEDEKVKAKAAANNEGVVGGDDGNETTQISPEERINELEAALFKNHNLYDLHVEYVTLLRSSYNLPKLRNARERFNKHFPLTPAMWTEWVSDETALDVKDYTTIKSLFDRAHGDYLSPELFVKEIYYFTEVYTEVLEDEMDEDEEEDEDDEDEESNAKEIVTVDFIRKICQDAVQACGKHFTKGGKVWEQYLTFELTVFGNMVRGGASEDDLTAQKARVLSVIRRWLAHPHEDMQTPWQHYQEWKTTQGMENDAGIEQKYKESKSKCAEYKKIETSLAAEDASAIRIAYYAFIAHEEKTTPDRVQLAFERFAVNDPLNPDMWQSYMEFVDSTHKSERLREHVLAQHRRSVRNCPWSAPLWCSYLVSQERCEKSFYDVKALFEEALQNTFSSSSEYLSLWLAFCQYCARQAPPFKQSEAEENVPEEVATFRANIDAAMEYVTTYFGEGDPSFATASFYKARVEAQKFGALEAARTVFEDLVRKGSFGKQLLTWQEYFRVEVLLGDAMSQRKVLQRAVQFVRDFPDTACAEYVSFEETIGDLENVTEAKRRVRNALKQARGREKHLQEKQAKWEKSKGRQKGKASDFSNKGQKKDFKSKKQYDGKRTADDASKNVQKETQEEAQSVVSDDNDELQTKRAKLQTEEPAKKKEEKEIVDPHARDEEFHKVFDAEKAARTVFVKNLSFEVDEAALQNRFEDCGEIEEIRVVKGKNGKSKGFAYIEYKNASSRQFALSKDRQFLGDRPMLVDPCVDRSKEGSRFNFSGTYDPTTLFVKNIDVHAMEDEIKAIFEKYGGLKDVRLMRTPTGQSRGFAYVEYESSKDAATAQIASNRTKIKGKEITVEISNPPKRQGKVGNNRGLRRFGAPSTAPTSKASTSSTTTTTTSSSTTSTKSTTASSSSEKSSSTKPHGKPNKEGASFSKPRFLGRSAAGRGRGRSLGLLSGKGKSSVGPSSKSAADASSTSDKKPAMKSNSDFRAMFLNKKK